jgi:predicted esterase
MGGDPLRRLTAAALIGSPCVVGVAVALSVWPHRAVPAAAQTPAEGPLAPAEWCAPGFDPIPGEGCLATAAPSDRPPALVVYLHGRYARGAATDEIDRQRRLGIRAKARGFSVLTLRGHLGACSAPELADWYCWPSNPSNAASGPAVVQSWERALAGAEGRAGRGRRFLLGFSNGGYFAGLIASRNLLDVDALAVAHGGPVEPVHPVGGAPPILLLSADDDVAQDDMIRFDEALTREHWAHDAYARSGGHGLPDQDIEAALTFFARSGEPLPLRPPLGLHRAVRRMRDAGEEAETPTVPESIGPEPANVTDGAAAAESDGATAPE